MDSGNVRVCSGILGLACLLQTMPYGMCGANLKALGAILEPLGVRLGGSRGLKG